MSEANDDLVARLHNRRFVAVENPNGVADHETEFHYLVRGSTIVGTYAGGSIAVGHIVARAVSGREIDTLFHCVTADGELRAGRSRGALSLDQSGLLHVRFEWAWLTGDGRGGHSHHVEIPAARPSTPHTARGRRP